MIGGGGGGGSNRIVFSHGQTIGHSILPPPPPPCSHGPLTPPAFHANDLGEEAKGHAVRTIVHNVLNKTCTCL